MHPKLMTFTSTIKLAGCRQWLSHTCRMTAGEHCSVYASYSLCLSFQKRTWNSSCTAVRCSLD